MTKRINEDDPDSGLKVQGIKACLDQLHDEATDRGLTIAAVLIGAASEAIADEITREPAKLSPFAELYVE